MKDIDGLELPKKKIEYLMFLSGTDHPVRTSEIATHFGVDPSTVTKTVESLAESGLVDHEPYRGVVLTGRGRSYTSFLIRRHRLLGLVFSRYGLSEGEADRQARDIGGYVAKDTIDKICASLGHPSVGIGGTIPHDYCCCCPGGGTCPETREGE
jgi:Mn-dependent DtxR family transcriptional regulator